MQHISVPLSEVAVLVQNPELARISNDQSHMMAIIGSDLHILVGDFTGIENEDQLEEVLKRNLP